MAKPKTKIKGINGLPVHGYKAQSPDAVALVNHNKLTEERLLRELDKLAFTVSTDKQWLATARTHFEQGFMAMNRAIFAPERCRLPEDAK